jgi:hypothetical protein
MSRASPVVFSVAVEGFVDEAVLRRLLQDVGVAAPIVYGNKGKSDLLQRLRGYNQAASFRPWIVLVDLDQDFECAPPFRDQWLPNPAPHMCFRVAVREVESWLLADQERLAAFLSVPVSRIPTAPEAVDFPKRVMVDLARRSRRRAIREDMVPRPGSGRTVGSAYASRLAEFVRSAWRPEVAAAHSDSLRRCRIRLKALSLTWILSS